MKRLILTTALVAALLPSAGFAQTADPPVATPEVTVPEGFERQDMMLSADELIGQTVYDVTGEAIGDVNDLILSMEEDTAATGSTGLDATASPGTSEATGTDATATGTAEGDTSGAVAGDGVTTSEEAATDNEGAAATGDTATAPTVGEGDVGLGNATTGGSATGEAATGDATAAGDGASATDGSIGSEMSATEGGAATDGAAASGDAAVGGQAGTIGEVSHVVLDIGGFLGIGAHSVAVPVSDLAVYRSESDTRIYLPWTREQLEAVPEYSEGDPSTYGASSLPATGNN